MMKKKISYIFIS